MAALAEQAVAVATRQGRHPSAWTAGASGHARLRRPAGRASRRRGRPLGGGAATWEPLPPEAAYTLHAVHGAALADLGQRPVGLTEMRAARTDFGDTPVPPSMFAALTLLEHRAPCSTAICARRRRSRDWLGARVQGTGENLLLKAWTETAAGRHDAAAHIVAPCWAGRMCRPCSRSRSSRPACSRPRRRSRPATTPAGRAALDTALVEAEAIGVARPFALAGPCTQELLNARAAQRPGRLRRPGDRRARRRRADRAVLLSEREEAVLALLPSLLNAREIADEFTVSVNTVKSHIRSIYAKLGVSSRREAVRHAHDRGLLP